MWKLWVWGCTGVVEIAHKIQNGVFDRLSIQYLNSNFNGGTGSGWAGCGGNPSRYANFYSSTGKFIPWSDTNAQYQDGSNWACPSTSTVSASSISTNPNYPISSIQDLSISTHAVGQSTAIANIKNILNQNKGIAFSFFLPNSAAWNDFFTYWDSGSSTPYDISKFNGQGIGTGFGGHLVLCVGYDDASDSWIMLNSWGTAGGLRPDGTFKVKMSMNYNVAYPGGYAMYWETLGVTFTGPTVTNSNGASAVITSSARLNGEVTSTGGQNPTVHIYWGTTDGATNQASWQHDENLGTKGVGTFYRDISSLAWGTTYYYRCLASNSAGSSWAGSTARFSTIGTTNPIALQASNGMYVCAGGGGGFVYANSPWTREWETFKLIDLGNNNIALQANNGQYVCAGGGGGGFVYANSPWTREWETFKLIDLGNNNIALQANNGQYVCAGGGGGGFVYANSPWTREWETFKLIDLGNNNIALQANNGQYVCAGGGGGGFVYANSPWTREWETFKLIRL